MAPLAGVRRSVRAIAAVSVLAALGQSPAGLSESALREYAGVYRWSPDSYVYLQLWDEFTGFGKPRELVSFDESGEVRTLYASGKDAFVAGPGIALSAPIESRIRFERDAHGKIISLVWDRSGAAQRRAPRVEIEREENVRFSNGEIRLAGTLVSPAASGSRPAVILVHGSGAENREYMLPWARFLVRHGIAVLGYDKRGVGESTGDWNTATFDDLAGDVVAAFDYLKTRRDIDHARIGLLGISQAGWIMPIAANRAKGVAFLISISGAGVPAAETTIDQARNEMTMTGMPPRAVDAVVELMKLQYEFARTGAGWDQYAAKRAQLVTRMGQAPPSFPGTPDDPYFGFIRRIYFYDPAPALRQLATPALALWGELDNNVLAEKNKSAWEAALKTARNPDYTLKILPKADHAMWEGKTGSNAETRSLQRFVPEYITAVRDWLVPRVTR
ncbi:MAG TPA: alpha/beta fold hydrolase [Vicinamibacterales bacterium]